jgi:hypothetical protein
MPIVKTVFQVIVLHDSDTDISCWDFSDVVSQMRDGEIIGSHYVISNGIVPVAEIKHELKALGNDGTFFDLEDDY